MRMLVATARDDHPGDYCFATVGEPVTPLLPPCSVSGECGCSRAFDGLESDRATTTAMVVERPDLDLERLLELLDGALDRAAAVPGRSRLPSSDAQLAEIVRIASSLPIGTVLRRNGHGYRVDEADGTEGAA